jgi:EAL domain-containing protein (putative c-di-GMP-specific phosphodiesterase class I)
VLKASSANIDESADTLARLGGDEFIVLLPAAGKDQAREVTGRILAGMREPFALGELTVTVGASVGIVNYPTHGQDAETLVQRADIAMYLAKGRGGGEVLYDPAEDPYDRERLRLIGDLRDAIRDRTLQLHYQPQFSAGDLHLVGAEALVRWQHPTRGLLAPGDFIALAEHAGVIRPLTLEVLRTAAAEWRIWHEEGIDVPIAVNLSVASLLDNQLVDDLSHILAEERMPADCLALEITESTVMTDPQATIAMLERLAAMGIGLSVDDCGTGHSSLAYLRRLPVHELKIDRTFVSISPSTTRTSRSCARPSISDTASACASSPKALKTPDRLPCSNITPAIACRGSTSAGPSHPTPCWSSCDLRRCGRRRSRTLDRRVGNPASECTHFRNDRNPAARTRVPLRPLRPSSPARLCGAIFNQSGARGVGVEEFLDPLGVERAGV